MAEPEAAAPPPAAAKGGGGKILPILLGLNTVLLGGVLFFAMKKPAPAAATASAAAPETDPKVDENGKPLPPSDQPGPPLRLENFIIQLRTADTERYVRVAFDLELRTEADKEVVTPRLAIIRDAVIRYFSDRTLDELRGSEGMDRVKTDMMKKLDEIVPGKRIKNIYLVDFIVQ